MGIFKLIFLLILLQSCAFNGEPNYHHNYTKEELSSAEQFVDIISFESWFDLQEKCNAHFINVYGCLSATDAGEIVIYLYKELSKGGLKVVYTHELGHVYDLFVLNRSIKETSEHIGWDKKHGYRFR